MVQSFAVQVSGSKSISVRYRAVVCNAGATKSDATDLRLHYDLPAAPTATAPGDATLSLPALQPGYCYKAETVRANVPNGLYTSWAVVDANNKVQESNEGNNLGGPTVYPVWHKVPANTCDDACAFAVKCGAFPKASAPQCKTWCQGQTIKNRDCLIKATSQGDCPAFKACNAPPPPPPPPPPAVCSDLCTHVSSKCNKAGLYWTCFYACQALTPAKLQCAQQAKVTGQCAALLACLSLS